MKLQFFHVHDLCRFIDVILEARPHQHIFNVGNKDTVSIREWVELCYRVANKPVEFVPVFEDMEQRNYFSFYNYEYYLDVTKQYQLMPETKPLFDGLLEAYEWYKDNQEQVAKKPFFDYIDNHLNIYNK